MPQAPVVEPKKTERELILERNKDQANWEWVEIPATDLFGESHPGVSINFERFDPEKDEEGRYTGEPKKYFVDPEKAKEVRRLLDQFLRSQMRIMQPGQDKKMVAQMNKGSKAQIVSNPGF